MRRPLRTFAIYALLIAACLTVVSDISRMLSFVVFAVVFAVILGIVWRDGEITVAAHPAILAGTLAVWGALIVGFVSAPTVSGLLRLGAFIGISGSLLFILPSFFTAGDVFRALAWVSASLVVVALPTVFVGELGPFGIWGTDTLFGATYYIPMSVFDNPNLLGAVAALGAVGGVGEVLSTQTPMPMVSDQRKGIFSNITIGVLVGICGLGVVLSTGRAALLALVAGVGVIVTANLFGRRVVAALTVLGGLTLIGVTAIAANLLPGPALFENIGLSGRGMIWEAILRAVSERPLFGFGPGADGSILAEFFTEDPGNASTAPHSSYFRMFFIGGLVGGIGYLVVHLSALWVGIANITPQKATAVAMAVSVSVLLIFSGVLLFGLHPVSVVGALAVGTVQLGTQATRSVRLSRTALKTKTTTEN